MKTIPGYVTKSLGDKKIESLRTKLIALSWLDFAFPAVKQGIRDNLTYPQVYNQDGTDTHQYLRPSNNVKSFLFFEKGNYNISKDEIQNIYDFSLICWMNLEVINTYDYDFTDLLARDVLEILKINQCDDFTVNFDNPFSDYSGIIQEDNQFLMYPYSAFKIDFTAIGQNC